MDDKMSRVRVIPEEEVEKNQEHKKRKRKTAEEKLAEALAKKKKEDERAKKRNEEIAALREEILTSKWKQLIREANAAGADEDIVISIIMRQKDAIISRAVEETKNRNSK